MNKILTITFFLVFATPLMPADQLGAVQELLSSHGPLFSLRELVAQMIYIQNHDVRATQDRPTLKDQAIALAHAPVRAVKLRLVQRWHNDKLLLHPHDKRMLEEAIRCIVKGQQDVQLSHQFYDLANTLLSEFCYITDVAGPTIEGMALERAGRIDAILRDLVDRVNTRARKTVEYGNGRRDFDCLAKSTEAVRQALWRASHFYASLLQPVNDRQAVDLSVPYITRGRSDLRFAYHMEQNCSGEDALVISEVKNGRIKALFNKPGQNGFDRTEYEFQCTDKSQILFCALFDGHNHENAKRRQVLPYGLTPYRINNTVDWARERLHDLVYGHIDSGSLDPLTDACAQLRKELPTAYKREWCDGTTVTALMRYNNTVSIAFVGDSSYLINFGFNKFVSPKPHTLSSPKEAKYVFDVTPDEYKENIIDQMANSVGGLATTRSIGDLNLFECCPSPKPILRSEFEIYRLPVTAPYSFIVLATDGLWDEICPERVNLIAQEVYSKGGNSTAIVTRLKDELKKVSPDQRKNDTDDVTIIVLTHRL